MRKIAPRLCLFLCATALALAGCDSLPMKSSAAPEAAAQAERDFADGNYARAAQGFLDAAHSRKQRDYFRLRAAEAWREEGDLTAAAAALQGISSKRFDAETNARLGLLQAELALNANQAVQALAMLDRVATQVPSTYLPRYHETRARAAEAFGDAFSSAAERALLGQLLEKHERAANSAKIQRLLDDVSDEALAAGATALNPEHPLYPFAARALIDRRLPLPYPLPRTSLFDEDEAAPMQADGYRPLRRIGLLLPSDGTLAAAANAVREGFFAAYFDEHREKPDITIHDSGNDTASALDAWRTARAEGAQLIVGPLGREQVAALFEQDDGSVPTLALNRGGSTPPPPGSVSFALAPEDEGSAAAERIAQRGGKRVLAIHTGDEQGQRATAALAERLTRFGGSIAATAVIPAGEPNYAPAIQSALRELDASFEAPPPDMEPGTKFEPRLIVNVDVIFFAGRTEQARLLVPQLAVAGISGLPIYATSQIAAGAGNPRLDRELDGIEFTEAPWLTGRVPAGLPEREELAGLTGASGAAARLFAFGIDAFRLVGYYEHLSSDPAATLAGATGELRLDGFGNVQRRPAWARFSGGRIQPAPEQALIGDGLQFTSP
ncbi:MAG: penicillin-binding protein activator [Lysobacteraceae bacterium]